MADRVPSKKNLARFLEKTRHDIWWLMGDPDFRGFFDAIISPDLFLIIYRKTRRDILTLDRIKSALERGEEFSSEMKKTLTTMAVWWIEFIGEFPENDPHYYTNGIPPGATEKWHYRNILNQLLPIFMDLLREISGIPPTNTTIDSLVLSMVPTAIANKYQ